MAGRVQIETSGELGDALSINPSFSFFTKRYSKHTSHASENYKISFPEGVYTDDFLDVPIPQKYGDILQDITISFVVNPVHVSNLGSNISPIDIFGISVIDYVELYVGDEKIDTVTSDDIFIEREFQVPESYRSSIDMLHGKHFQGSSDGEFLQEFYDGQYNTQGIDPFSTDEYRIGIPFYFHKRPGHGFPLCALREQELSLRIKLRPTIDVVFATQELFGDNLWDPHANNQLTERLELSDFKINLELVHLNTTERCMLRSKPIDILFEQRQRNEFMIEPQSKVGDFKLDFKNCVKELFFIAKKTGNWSDEQISILNELYKLDQYTDAQKERLTILKLIPVWGGVVTTALDSLVGEEDGDVRTAAIDAMLQAIYWGPTNTYTTYLNKLKDPSINTTTEAEYITALKTYLDSIPSQIITSQINATSNLNALIGQTDVDTRINIIDNNLLTIPNIPKFWGEEQVGILQLLKSTNLPEEELLIFGLRAHLTTASYYLSGLSELKPGATDQVATVTKLIEFLDNTKTEFDIIKLGMKAVLDSIPGKSEYLRARIVGALLKLGATLWGDPENNPQSAQLKILLKSLLINPGNDTDIINTQAATITGLKAYLDGVYNQLGGVKTSVDAALTSLAGETSGTDRVFIVDTLLAIPDFWTATEEGYLNTLKDSIFANTNTETNLIFGLRVYTNAKVTGVQFLNEGMLDVIGDFPGTTSQQRIASVEVLRQTPIWGDDIIKLVLDYDNDDETYAPILTGYLTGILGAIPTLKFRLNALKGGINGVLDSLPATAAERDPIMLGIATSHAWSDEAFGLLNLLRTPSSSNDANYIAALKQKGIEENVPNMTGYTQFDQNNVIDGIISLNLWGEKYYNLNDLRQIAPGFIGEQSVINALVAYLNNLPDEINYLVNGVNYTLTNLPPSELERTPIIDRIKTIPIWEDDQLNTLDTLKTPSGGDSLYISQLTGYISGILMVYINTFSLLDPTYTLTEQDVNTLNGYKFWGQEQRDILQKLGDIVGGSSSTTEEYYKRVLTTYMKGLNFYLQTVNVGLSDTITDAPVNVTDPVDRNILVELLIRFDDIWEDDQLTLLNEFRTPGSLNHTTAVNAITNYLDTLSGTIITLLGLLTSGTTSAELQNTDFKAAWGGYFYYLLEALKDPTIAQEDETDIISKLTTYVNITSLSETRNNNLKFLITQLTVAYPESIFNKWVRAKKNVPLMYSKQKTTTLDCDGTQILDKTTGSNMFLSASLPNLYHKRSPNFRNINMYSFALYPGELRPSGHLNFSTIKDARVTMELEYDGRHGTFDFDDNYIEVFGIEPIYFPKQVIIIAKSYNMMIIRNGKAKIIY